ncbi:MAG: hypothetical protein IJG36_00975 [Synergistaceae bacterium]|nr:hypothetical protein [Synergistaceae bacterium]MBQ6002128.1 hypothetical protein [Synergistaceae bacterium]MBR0248664.1 hypothetical protein [Synergistaceae bacterium]
MPEVKQERTFWRDAGLSQRHRQWGWDCPMMDIDFLALEYDKGEPAVLVEYKNEHAETQYASHPSYQALIKLGNKAGLPVIACRYSDDYTKWRVVPLNAKAAEFVPESKILNEYEWVNLLYQIRGREITHEEFESMKVEI